MRSVRGKKVVVIGGNGSLGSAAVEAAIVAGANVTILSRHADTTPGATGVKGSITDPEVLRTVLADARGVVIAVETSRTSEQLEAVYVQGTRNVLSAMPAAAHIIFMGHIGTTVINRMPDYNRAKLRAEELIRDSGRIYTIIRPSWVLAAQRGVKLEQGDHYTGRRDDIGRVDLGAAIVAALESPEAHGKTFELYGGGERKPDWDKAFSALKLDTIGGRR